jgi:hypothetical protein
MKWKMVNESSREEVKALLEQAAKLASGILKGKIEKLISEELAPRPKFKGRELRTWQELCSDFEKELPDLVKADKEDRYEMMYELEKLKPDFCIFYENHDEFELKKMVQILRSEYPEYDVETHIDWENWAGDDCGFITLTRQK